MRISDAVVTNTISNNLRRSFSRITRFQKDLSTGTRIHDASDDPSSASRALQLRSDIRKNEQFQRNIESGIGFMNFVDSTMDDLVNTLIRVRGLAIQGSSDTVNPSDRKIIAREVNELLEHVIGVGQAKFRGRFVFAGTETLERPYSEVRDADGNVLSVGNTLRRSLRLESSTTAVGTLLSLTTPPSGTVTIGDQTVDIDLGTDSLNDIKAKIEAAAPTGVSVDIEESVSDGQSIFRLRIDGTTTAVDANNVLSTLQIDNVDTTGAILREVDEGFRIQINVEGRDLFEGAQNVFSAFLNLRAVRRLVDRLRPGGLLVLTVTFYTNEEGPFHLNCDRYTNESFYNIVKGLGMTELSPYSPRVFQKGDREGAVSSVPAPDRGARHRAFLETWQGPIRLNLGCGEDRRDGFINVDAHVPTADLQMDVFNLELGDATVDEIFSSHMLEHLGKFEVPSALKEWHRVLKPEGVLRLNLPDLEWVTEQWLNTPEKARWGWRLDTLYGLQTHPGEFHKTGFTADRIEALLREVGFPRVKTSYVWSHGMKCLWVEAFRAQAVAESDQGYPLPSAYFKEQFPTDFSTIAPYRPEECEAVLRGENWEIGWVGFERLPNGGAEFAVVAGVQAAGREMLLQGLQIFWNEGKKQNRVLIFPEYLQGTDEASRQRLGNAVGRALETKLADPASQNGSLTIARFEPDGSVSLNGAEAQPGGPVDLPTSLLLAKRYLLAQRFADGAEVLHFDCKSGYGAKLTARVAERVEAVGGSVADIALAAVLR